ncbi:MAG: sulfatase [bacterium]
MKKFTNKLWTIALIACISVIILFKIVEKNCLIAKNDGPNIMLIVMDTVRKDHLSCYGYSRETTPHLNELIRNSRVYYNAYSTSCWTSPAHASLFTGLYTISHKTSQEYWVMSDQLTTLAEVLSCEGYETIGIVENPMLGKPYNFHQGFSTYYETWKKDFWLLLSCMISEENSAFSLLKRSLRQRDKNKPFFIFINLIEAHAPYDSSQQFYNQFLQDSILSCESNRWQDYLLGRIQFSDAELTHLKKLYDAEILYVDYYIGKIITELKKRNLWENTMFIVTSDHGENIGDHNLVDHVFCLYEPAVRIPLIIHDPQLIDGPSKEYAPVQLTDIFPTLLKRANVSVDDYFFQGHDLFKERGGEEEIVFCEYYYPEQALRCFKEEDRKNKNIRKFKRQLRSIIHDNKKLIWSSDGYHELYDLAKDTHEENNLFFQKEYQAMRQEMMRRLECAVRHYGGHSAVSSSSSPYIIIDRKTKARLRSLGYVATFPPGAR